MREDALKRAGIQGSICIIRITLWKGNPEVTAGLGLDFFKCRTRVKLGQNQPPTRFYLKRAKLRNDGVDYPFTGDGQ